MRLALHGLPGAGKSTFSRLLAEEFALAGTPCLVLRLAEPLYQLQALVHRVAGRPMADPAVQDGALLNDLAAHLRRINPDSLTGDFAHRVEQARQRHPGAVLLCDDMRAADTAALVALDFRLVHVTAPDALRRERKARRGDLSAGREDHPSEAPVTVSSEHEVRNGAGLEELRGAARLLVGQVAG
ncbi:hypothetical protein ACFWXO_21960 [Kitasatospora sp. NPDC059088]|uniref:hypothetical protein n=1 Tax=Kitasatospora sp. NPDC059088 TaxID=3346722 RepID=UPI0036C2143C